MIYCNVWYERVRIRGPRRPGADSARAAPSPPTGAAEDQGLALIGPRHSPACLLIAKLGPTGACPH
jgi:hypothetical protein